MAVDRQSLATAATAVVGSGGNRDVSIWSYLESEFLANILLPAVPPSRRPAVGAVAVASIAGIKRVSIEVLVNGNMAKAGLCTFQAA